MWRRRMPRKPPMVRVAPSGVRQKLRSEPARESREYLRGKGEVLREWQFSPSGREEARLSRHVAGLPTVSFSVDRTMSLRSPTLRSPGTISTEPAGTVPVWSSTVDPVDRVIDPVGRKETGDGDVGSRLPGMNIPQTPLTCSFPITALPD